MTQIKSIFPDIPSTNVAASRDFYLGLLGLTVAWESDWYVLLHGDGPEIQLAIVEHGHGSIPETHHDTARGVLISFEVDDATKVWTRARELELPVAQELRDEEFGQRHFMVADPNGLLVDVIETLFVPDAG
ncbi:VOC family protein [Nocardia sp. NPDC055321]